MRSEILELYKRVEREKKTNNEYKKLADEYCDKRKLFEEMLTEKQVQDFDEILSIQDYMNTQEFKDYFKERICIRNKINDRVITKE